MTEHRNESLMDKVKDALGMGDDDNARDDGLAEDREPGFGGVGQMMDDRDTDASMGRTGTTGTAGTTGMDGGATAGGTAGMGGMGTMGTDSGTIGEGAINEGGAVTGGANVRGDLGTTNRPGGPDYAGEDATLTGAGTSEWSRGEAASGETPFGQDEEEDLGLEGTNRPT